VFQKSSGKAEGQDTTSSPELPTTSLENEVPFSKSLPARPKAETQQALASCKQQVLENEVPFSKSFPARQTAMTQKTRPSCKQQALENEVPFPKFAGRAEEGQVATSSPERQTTSFGNLGSVFQKFSGNVLRLGPTLFSLICRKAREIANLRGRPLHI
jgi:hypothetical protein